MKNNTKMMLAALLLLLIPLKNIAQQPYRQYAEDGIMLNFFEIDDLDFRLYLLNNMEHDDRFSLLAEEEYGQFIINPSENTFNGNFFDTFESFYNSTLADYGFIEKADRFNLVPLWKENVTSMYFTSITMDVALRRAITDNSLCANSDPFCTSDVITFDAASSSQTANQLEGYDFDDGCIGSSYNPSWYHMRINIPGQFVIHMEGHDPNNGTNRDIDFCIWGPYDNPTTPCVAQLTSNKIIDCCYSSSYTEDIYLGYLEGDHHHNTSHGDINYHVPEIGEYYILMITNFSQQPCTISFTKTEGSGPGETDCGILPGIASNGGPYCVGETITLNVNSQAGATYSWTGPNGFTSNSQNPTIPNCTYEMGGIYTCVTTVNSQTTTGTTDVIIFAEPVANFDFTTVCEGETTQFTSTASTAPVGHEITSYHWDFGDGETAETQDATHTYAAAGTYTVTHRVTTGRRCEDEITQDVVVLAMPVPTITVNPTSVQYGGVATLTADPGVEGNFIYHWEPANMVTNPNSQTTQTVPLTETVNYTCTVTNADGDCSSTAQATAIMGGSNLTATASADYYEICEDGSTTLHAHPLNGTENYTYSWSPANLLNNTTIQNPVATPPVGTTTFTCIVSDGIVSQTVSVDIIVHPKEEKHIFESICTTDTYNFYGQVINAEGTYTHTLQTQYHCDSTIILHLSHWEPNQETDVYIIDSCDQYVWDPYGHSYTTQDSFDPADHTYSISNTYHRNYSDIHGCDSVVSMHMHFLYTPDPTPIYPMDPNNAVPHWVITSTEFQINSYDFYFWDNNPSCDWDTVSWGLENDVDWLLEPFGIKGSCCKMYVLNYVEDTIWLKAKAINNCSGAEGIERKYWFVCSFYGTDEHPENHADFNVVPNPNNGQMTLHFENLTGKVNVKVYDMRGNLLDSFETYNSVGSNASPYDMKRQAEGIYFFIVTGKEGTISKKVVIQP